MKNKVKAYCIIGLCLLLIETVYAAEAFSSFGEIAEVLTVGTDVVTKLIHGVCMALGVSLFIMAFSLFKAHRTNPKFVPLDRPILYIVLGFVLIAIPFLGRIFGPTGSTQDYYKLHEKVLRTQDIDAPIEWGNDYDH